MEMLHGPLQKRLWSNSKTVAVSVFRILAALAAFILLLVDICSGDDEAADMRQLVDGSFGRVLVIRMTPLANLSLALQRDGSMSVVGWGLNLCNGPAPGRWAVEQDTLCLDMPWQTNVCFALAHEGQGLRLHPVVGPHAMVQSAEAKNRDPKQLRPGPNGWVTVESELQACRAK
jgi:hypothetical protein